MNFYLIVSSEEDTPSKELLQKLEPLGEVVVIRHEGRLKEVTDKMKDDKKPKLLGVDPGTFEWDLDVEAIDDIPNVKAVFTSSTSFDWIKPDELKKRKIKACNVPGFSSDSVAEYALCMAIETARKLPMTIKNDWKMAGEVDKPTLLKGKVAGIVGLGRIGTRMAEVCKGIGMEVVYWSRESRDSKFKSVDLDELFKISDVVMPALVENEETKKLITRERLDLMKPTAILVGINRVKDIWDEEYVLEKVKKGEIGGYAFEGENAKDPKTYEGNVWALPAMAWYTQDSLENLIKIWVENMEAFAKGNPQNVVN